MISKDLFRRQLLFAHLSISLKLSTDPIRAKYNKINIVINYYIIEIPLLQRRRLIYKYMKHVTSYYNSKIINNPNKSFTPVSEYLPVTDPAETKTTPETKGTDGARYPAAFEDQLCHEININKKYITLNIECFLFY